MNEFPLTRLKVMVERAVRPVRSSTARKRKMREELLAHVSGVFEEEAKRGDEPAALARTQERFGPAAELTTQLQASVPRTDCFGRFAEELVYRPGESTLRQATRLAVMVSLFFGAALLSVLLAQHRFPGLGRSPIGTGQAWPIIPAVAAGVFCFTFLNHWMRDALYGPSGRSWLRAVLVGGAASLLIPGVTFGVCLTLTGEPWSSMMEILLPDRLGIPLLPWAMLLTWVPVAVTAYVKEKELRYRREWDNLQIG
jgi:hypothetical protein